MIARASVQFLPQHRHTLFFAIMKISQSLAFDLLAQKELPFLELFKYGNLTVEIYQPELEDHQMPHTRDEVYIIASGTGRFQLGMAEMDFKTGDFLFVPAFEPHRFIAFSEDFATWVLFIGPEGGAAQQNRIKKIW